MLFCPRVEYFKQNKPLKFDALNVLSRFLRGKPIRKFIERCRHRFREQNDNRWSCKMSLGQSYALCCLCCTESEWTDCLK